MTDRIANVFTKSHAATPARRSRIGNVHSVFSNLSHPDVGSSCQSLWLGYYVCIGIPGTPTTAPSSSRTSATGVATPSPIRSDVTGTCNRFSQSGPSGGTCNGFLETDRCPWLHCMHRIEDLGCAARIAKLGSLTT